MQNFAREHECINLGEKISDLGILKVEFKKIYWDIRNQHPGISLNEKCCATTKMPKFGTKNASFRYFSAKTGKQ